MDYTLIFNKTITPGIVAAIASLVILAATLKNKPAIRAPSPTSSKFRSESFSLLVR